MGSRGGGTGKWEKLMLIPAELGVRDARELGVRMEGPWEELFPRGSPREFPHGFSSFTFTTCLK